MIFKITDMPGLDSSIKGLIADGRYSMYLLQNGQYLLVTPGKATCGCGHSDLPPKYYYVSSDGNVYELLEYKPDSPIVEVINFERPPKKHWWDY